MQYLETIQDKLKIQKKLPFLIKTKFHLEQV